MTRLIIILGTGFVAGLIAFNAINPTELSGWIGFGVGTVLATLFTHKG